MRRFTLALALSALLPACRESPAPPNIPPVEIGSDATHGAAKADTDAPKGKVTTQPPGRRLEAPAAGAQAKAAAPAQRGDEAVTEPNGDADAVEACVDAWLAEKNLNQYGDPKDTVYAGGTPLFDEATGRTMDRIDHVLLKHPELRERCLK